jgi:hypothetical protein
MVSQSIEQTVGLSSTLTWNLDWNGQSVVIVRASNNKH